MSARGTDLSFRTDPARCMRRSNSVFAVSLAAATLCLLLSVFPTRGDAAPDEDDAYLDQLLGKWDMTGSMSAKPLHYHASGQRVLQGKFLRLHMIDAHPTPQYEADVFIGFDAERHDFSVHWLDRFGAAGARVVGSGKRDGPQLLVTFPYDSGAFRDTFVFKRETGTWSLLLESQEANGTWSTFATYSLTRPKPH